MNNQPRQKLCEIIAQYGRELCEYPRRCEGLLRDFCGEHKREINVLVGALKERITADLLASSPNVPHEVLLVRLTKRLQDNLALAENAARWAVESWALALGVISIAESETRIPKPEEPRSISGQSLKRLSRDERVPRKAKSLETQRHVIRSDSRYQQVMIDWAVMVIAGIIGGAISGAVGGVIFWSRVLESRLAVGETIGGMLAGMFGGLIGGAVGGIIFGAVKGEIEEVIHWLIHWGLWLATVWVVPGIVIGAVKPAGGGIVVWAVLGAIVGPVGGLIANITED